MILPRFVLPSLLLAAAAAAQNSALPANAARAEQSITDASLRGPISFLSSDLLEGRGVGSRGDLLSRAYIRSEFERYGLLPGAGDGAYEQPVPIIGIKSIVTSPLSASGAKGTADFTAPEDYTAVAGSDADKASWAGAELVFVGYGIDAPEQNWDDYKGADLKGKVLLFMNNDPSDDPGLFAGSTRLYYGRWSYKYEEAARRGAVGAIVIHTTPSAGYPFQVIQSSHGRENFWLPFGDDQETLPIRSWCSEDAARKLCALGDHDLDKLRSKAETRKFSPVPLGVTVNLSLNNEIRQLESANVLAKLPGSDPELSSEVVVVTAHFDHLGIAKPRNGDEIYNGALDNATGTAGVLALARACSMLDPAPKRSILFAAVTAEESGLLGSKWLAQNLPCDKKKIVANYNIDGLNIWGPTRDIEFIGYGKNSLTDLAKQVASRRDRTVQPDANPDLGLFYRSDHFNFARIGVPAAFFKAGREFFDRPADRRRMKASYTTVHYHQPTDEMDTWWNLQGAVDDLHLILECMLLTCDGPAPTWTPGDEFEKLR